MIDLNKYKHYKCEFDKLQSFGFVDLGSKYEFTQILDDEFEAKVSVSEDSLSIDVLESETGERWSLFYVKDAQGGFIGEINAKCETLMDKIISACFKKCIFQSEQALEIIDYVNKKYNCQLEYLWEKFPENAIWRRVDGGKWFGAILTVAKNKLGFEGNEKLEVIDIRNNDLSVVDGVNILPGYHMNKKSWITIPLDGRLKNKVIFDLIDKSYLLAK